MLTMLLIIFLLILIILSQFCADTKENMTNNYNKFLNNQTSIIIKNNVYKQDEPIEITSLPTCNKEILVDYGLNINTINNDGVTINQIINDPLVHTIEIDNNNYNLVQIEWRKTNFMFNGKPIGLTLHLIHSDFKNLEKLNIIIPLDFLESDENIESFKNVFYKRMDNFFKTHVPKAIEKLDKMIDLNKMKGKFNLSIKYKRKYNIKDININSLLKNKEEIPIYECCKNTVGAVIHMNLCILKTIIESSNVYYIIKEENGNTNLIIEPNIFNEENGLLIRNYLEPDNNLIYLKP